MGPQGLPGAPTYVLANHETAAPENSWVKWVILAIAAALVAVGLIGVWAWVLSTDTKDTRTPLYNHDLDYSPHQGAVAGHGPQPGYSPVQQPMFVMDPRTTHAPTMQSMGMAGSPYAMGGYR